jgi:hypothetical protein
MSRNWLTIEGEDLQTIRCEASRLVNMLEANPIKHEWDAGINERAVCTAKTIRDVCDRVASLNNQQFT